MSQLLPYVSILIPAFQAEKFIQASIQSVVDQTWVDWELLILNDGSTDRTKEVVQECICQYPNRNIRLLDHEHNLGLIAARNHLLGAASGKYIAWLDADDLYSPEKLAKQIQVLDGKDRVDVCATEYFTLDMSNQRLKKRKRYQTDTDLKALLSVYNPICNSTTMIKADIAKQFHFEESTIFAEDYDIWCRMASRGLFFYTIKDALLTYRIHDNQISRAKQEEMDNAFLNSQTTYLWTMSVTQIPQKMHYQQRLKQAVTMLIQLNKALRGRTGKRASFLANAEIYARFQYRRNGFFTIFTRSERWLIALYASWFS
jgi:glycosyltransferase involved in cell wall biosynthesis